jgi:hypothetical protein
LPKKTANIDCKKTKVNCGCDFCRIDAENLSEAEKEGQKIRFFRGVGFDDKNLNR